MSTNKAVSNLPFGDVVEFVESTMKKLGVTTPEEAKQVLENLSNDGRGEPFTKFCNSRNWNQSIAYATLRQLGYTDDSNTVLNAGFQHFDGDRHDDIVYLDDFTLYNAPSGVLMVNLESPNIARITGEFVGCEEKGYNEEFRTNVHGSGKQKEMVGRMRSRGFVNLIARFS